MEECNVASSSTGELNEVIKVCDNIVDKINKLIKILSYEDN